MTGHIGTETRPGLLREAAVGNIARRRPSGCKALSVGRKMTLPTEEAPANSVPAAAVIRRVQALIGITGRKGHVGGLLRGV